MSTTNVLNKSNFNIAVVPLTTKISAKTGTDWTLQRENFPLPRKNLPFYEKKYN
jgi:hypothetical protein